MIRLYQEFQTKYKTSMGHLYYYTKHYNLHALSTWVSGSSGKEELTNDLDRNLGTWVNIWLLYIRVLSCIETYFLCVIYVWRITINTRKYYASHGIIN